MNIPVYLSRFVGREAESGEIGALIREKSIRLLTLTGPGGSGKIRLAYEAVVGLVDAFEDGLFWAELVGLSDPAAVPQAVATALDVSPAPGQTPLEALTAFLRHRESLLVLDNCEHVIAACAQLVGALLRACPALHVLATSRQPLGVEGEQVWPVPPLSYPEEDAVSLDSLPGYDALALFAARARLARPEFRVNADNAPALVKIARLLDGMPLSIELAAAQVKVLDLSQMTERLENQLAVLAGGEPASDARHQSMRETIRWSHDLLSEAEKILFRRLSVFSGGFSLQAPEAVCSDAATVSNTAFA